MWLKEEGFKDVLQTWWEGLNFRRSASFVFAAKLQALKSLLKNWNREVLELECNLLVLIPKKGGTEDLRDFRLITKVISKDQNAIVKGRQILCWGSRNIHSSPSPTIGFNFRKISSSQECFQHLSSVKYELEVWPFNSWRIKNSPSTKAPRSMCWNNLMIALAGP
ncbi:hypothetical protein CK203_084889 [Vitis vinifera]|uniref:Uncharacterized protein n=1 Tax=Vitis vinifera TaxID=29760 RepID=A0A438BT98_VITVI|nr:hypothetical protein CK203_084889 [Vitis vinifera]